MVSYMQHRDLSDISIDSSLARAISDNVRRVEDRIAAACERSGRDRSEVKLLAATKTRTVGEIMAAIDAGVRLIGENRPQEITAKIEGLRSQLEQRGLLLAPESAALSGAARSESGNGSVGNVGSAGSVGYHLIGQLQSNKINKVLPYVDVIESVDSLTLAEKLAKRAVTTGTEIGVYLEINESGEESKSGCAPSHAIDYAQRIGAMGGLRLLGLMTVGAKSDDERVVRNGFDRLVRTREQILATRAQGVESCTELSMGMSGDLEWAIESGSTLVRIGSAIFGERAFK